MSRVSARFEELGWSSTPIGEVSLRRRRDPVTDVDVFEVKLGDEFLMSSLFAVAEIEVARLALARLDADRFDVVVGGLGHGYTAQAVLADPRVGELVVIDLLEPVIEWPQQGLLPLGAAISSYPRCGLVRGNFFAMSANAGLDPAAAGRRFDAVVVDIDHSPRGPPGRRERLVLPPLRHPATRDVHQARRRLLALVERPPGAEYLAAPSDVFVDVDAQVITFPNSLQGHPATNTVYLATARD